MKTQVNRGVVEKGLEHHVELGNEAGILVDAAEEKPDVPRFIISVEQNDVDARVAVCGLRAVVGRLAEKEELGQRENDEKEGTHEVEFATPRTRRKPLTQAVGHELVITSCLFRQLPAKITKRIESLRNFNERGQSLSSREDVRH